MAGIEVLTTPENCQMFQAHKFPQGDGLTKLKQQQPGGHGGNRSLNQDIVHSMQPALLGSSLDKMNVSMALNLAAYMDQSGKNMKHGLVLDFFEWTRRAVYEASLEATWGPDHPLRDPDVEQAFM